MEELGCELGGVWEDGGGGEREECVGKVREEEGEAGKGERVLERRGG